MSPTKKNMRQRQYQTGARSNLHAYEVFFAEASLRSVPFLARLNPLVVCGHRSQVVTLAPLKVAHLEARFRKRLV